MKESRKRRAQSINNKQVKLATNWQSISPTISSQSKNQKIHNKWTLWHPQWLLHKYWPRHLAQILMLLKFFIIYMLTREKKNSEHQPFIEILTPKKLLLLQLSIGIEYNLITHVLLLNWEDKKITWYYTTQKKRKENYKVIIWTIISCRT